MQVGYYEPLLPSGFNNGAQGAGNPLIPNASFYVIGAGAGTNVSFTLRVYASSPCTLSGIPQEIFDYPITTTLARPANPGPGTAPGAEARVELYPNPTPGLLNLTAPEGTRYEWAKVYDLQGRMVQEVQPNDERGVNGLDLGPLPAGMYNVQLYDGKRTSSQRVLKN